MTNVSYNLAIDAIFQKLKSDDLSYYKEDLNTIKYYILKALAGEKVYENLESLGKSFYSSGILIEDVIYIFDVIKEEIFAVMDIDTSPRALRQIKLNIDNARNAFAKGYLMEYVKDILKKIEKPQVYEKYLGVCYAIVLKEQAYFKEVLTAVLNKEQVIKPRVHSLSEFLYNYRQNDIIKDILKSEKTFLMSVYSLMVKLKHRKFENAIFLVKEMALNYFFLISSLGTLGQGVKSSKEMIDNTTGILEKRAYESIYKDVVEASSISNTPYCILRIKIKNLEQTRAKFGENASQELLKKSVDILKKSLREYDSLFKYKDDEFSIILLNANKKVADIIIDRIKDTIYKSYQYDTNEIIPEFEFRVSLT